MSIAPEKTIKAVEAYFKKLQKEDDPYTKWAKRNNHLKDWKAIKFFIQVMLDQRQPFERVIAAAEEFVEKRDKRYQPENFWQYFAKMSIRDIKEFCQFEPEGDYTGSYAGINANKFPHWLRDNAEKIVKEYGGRVENIWEEDLSEDNEEKIKEIHRRFKEFEGIGEGLANMATFSLVKGYGYAGGIKSQKFLRIKFDTHVKRVVEKAILTGNEELGSAKAYVQELNKKLKSPADFDQMLFKIGQEYCQYNSCEDCPINKACNTCQLRKDDENFFENEEDDANFSNLYTMIVEKNPHCFKRFFVSSFNLSCFSKNDEGNFEEIFDCSFSNDEKNREIKQNDTGISAENRELECTLRLEEKKTIEDDEEIIRKYFELKIDKLNSIKEHIDLNIYPYIGESNEVIFEGAKGEYKFYIKLGMHNKE